MDSFFPFWLFQLSLGNPVRVRAVLTLSSWDCTRSTLVCQQIPAQPIITLLCLQGFPELHLDIFWFHAIPILLTAGLQQMKCVPSLLRGFEPDQLSQSVLGFQGTAAQTLSQSLWSMAQLCPERNNTPGPSQAILFLIRNVSLLESCSAAGSPAPAKPLALAPCSGQGKSWSKVMQSDTNTEACAGQQLMPAIWIKGIQEQITAVSTEICFS